jgi:DNA-directed RNA polymerase
VTHIATQIPNLNAVIIDITPEQLRREMEHEQAMIEIGRVAAQNRLAAEKARGNGSVTAGGRALISGLSLALAERIVAKIAELEDGRVKRKPPEVRTLQLLPARDLAVIAIRSVTNSMASREPDKCTPQSLGFAIGAEVEDEHFARLFRQSDRGLFDLIIRRVNERSKNPAQRRKELMEAYARVEEDPASPKR